MTPSDSPSAQLLTELQRAVHTAHAARRPILHHLNADTTWLLQLPRPEKAVQRGARYYYNILLDPWLTGGQSDVASWFSQQFHAIPSAVQSIREIDELAFEAEVAAAGEENREDLLDRDSSETLIDAVAISHEFTDHCNQATLLEINRDVPVFAIKEAARLIESWKHFRTVVVVNVFGGEGDKDWRSTSVPPLPDWVGIGRLLTTDDVLNYHAALMITFNNKHANSKDKLQKTGSKRKPRHTKGELNEDDESAEAIIYTPHGIASGDLQVIPAASPPISTLAFLHGLHNVRIGTVTGQTALQLNLGANNGLQAQRILNAHYWISTHDEVKKGGGLISWFLQRDVLSLKSALEHERTLRQAGEKINGELGKILDSFDDNDCNWVDVHNGESKVLI